MNRILILFCALLSTVNLAAQKSTKGDDVSVIIENATVIRNGTILTIDYYIELRDSLSTLVEVLMSEDGGKHFNPIRDIEYLSGDIGLINTSGPKKIYFDVSDLKEQLYNKPLSFKVIANVDDKRFDKPDNDKTTKYGVVIDNEKVDYEEDKIQITFIPFLGEYVLSCRVDVLYSFDGHKFDKVPDRFISGDTTVDYRDSGLNLCIMCQNFQSLKSPEIVIKLKANKVVWKDSFRDFY